MAEHCTSLTYLNLTRCHVTDASISRVAKRCTGLVTLELQHCSDVSDASITLAAQHLKGLTCLNLYKCSKLSDESIVFVATLTRLTSLSLRNVPSPTDKSIGPIAEVSCHASFRSIE